MNYIKRLEEREVEELGMKYSRIIILCLFLLILTGCSVKYDLTINRDNTITETISGTVLNVELDNGENTDLNNYLYAFEVASPLIDEDDTFDKKIINNDNYKEFTFTYNYDKNYSKSSVLNKCFENYEYKETEDAYIFRLSGEFNCLYSDEIEVNLISDYVVIDNNADKVLDNKYTWYIDNSDYVNIEAIISKNIVYSNKEDNNLLPVFRIIGLCIFVIILLVALFVYRKKKINNM